MPEVGGAGGEDDPVGAEVAAPRGQGHVHEGLAAEELAERGSLEEFGTNIFFYSLLVESSFEEKFYINLAGGINRIKVCLFLTRLFW